MYQAPGHHRLFSSRQTATAALKVMVGHPRATLAPVLSSAHAVVPAASAEVHRNTVLEDVKLHTASARPRRAALPSRMQEQASLALCRRLRYQSRLMVTAAHKAMAARSKASLALPLSSEHVVARAVIAETQQSTALVVVSRTMAHARLKMATR